MFVIFACSTVFSRIMFAGIQVKYSVQIVLNNDILFLINTVISLFGAWLYCFISKE